MAPLALVPNFPTRLSGHVTCIAWFQSWPPGCVTRAATLPKGKSCCAAEHIVRQGLLCQTAKSRLRCSHISQLQISDICGGKDLDKLTPKKHVNPDKKRMLGPLTIGESTSSMTDGRVL